MSHYFDSKPIQCYTAECKQTNRGSRSKITLSGVQLQSSPALLVLFMRIKSRGCCSLVPLGLCQCICSFCFHHCRVRLRLQLRLLILNALSRHLSQPLLVVTTETIDLDQVVVSGLVLGLMEVNTKIKNMHQSRNHLSANEAEF